MTDFPLLFSPIIINRLELHNRLVMPAIHLNYTPDGKVTDQLVAFYDERSRGGTGLIVAGGFAISALAGGPDLTSMKDDSDIEGLSRLTAQVHEGEAKIGAQLFHAGAYARPAQNAGQAITSSTHISRYTGQEARAMSRDEVAQVQDEFARAARRAKEAGFDMVEILGSAGYLISQFLSPRINRREDEYGGSLENRFRFGLEVVAKVREAVGPDFCVGIRLAGNDFVPGSHTNIESRQFAAACVDAGVDLVNVTGGWHETRVPQITAEVPPAGFSYLARGIKGAVPVPVCASNLIHGPEMAEEVLSRGDCDLICMARPLIADPYFARKAATGRRRLIRPCVSCNQGCFDAVASEQPVVCMTNPRAGHESQVPYDQTQANRPLKVVVVGGGPAGCQTALTAARRGHKVTLLEAQVRLGGQPGWYCMPTEKPDFGEIGHYFAAALDEAGVEVRLDTRADLQTVIDLAPDTVVLATGSTPAVPSIPGCDLPHVVTAWDLLQGKRQPRGKVVVIGGGAVGLETALFVARRGALTPEQCHFLCFYKAETPEVIDSLISKGSHPVTVLEMLPKVGQDIGRSTRWVVLGKLKRFDVQLKTGIRVLSIEAEQVRIADDSGEHVEPADTVVLAAGAQPVNNLADEIKSRGFKVELVGDAAGPGDVKQSITQGFRLGNTL